MLAREINLGEHESLTVVSEGRGLVIEIVGHRFVHGIDGLPPAPWEVLNEGDCRRLIDAIEEHLT